MHIFTFQIYFEIILKLIEDKKSISYLLKPFKDFSSDWEIGTNFEKMMSLDYLFMAS